MIINFCKYQGTGNDFIIIDDRDLWFPIANTKIIAQLCDRRFGIGADGLILLQPHAELDFYMKYYNADGNESSMCGNGGRCIAAFAKHIGLVTETTKFMAIDGAHDALIQSINGAHPYVKLKMKSVGKIESRDDNTFVLNTGSPHYVQYLSNSINDLAIEPQAHAVRYNDEFASEGINVNFANVLQEGSITMRTYERGVEDETLSCGTGVTAAAIALALVKKLPTGNYTIAVTTVGGQLKVSFDYNEIETNFSNIWLQGPATFVYEGNVEV